MLSAFLSRTNRPGGGICFCFSYGLHIWPGMEVLVTFFPVRSAAYIFVYGKSCVGCLRSVELSVAHWSDRNVVGISLSHVSAHVAGYAFVSRTDCIYGAVWKCL